MTTFMKFIITLDTFVNISHILLETNSKKNVKNKDKIEYLLTAIGLSPPGSGYFTCTQI
jgi:hypothetical protein